MRKDADAEVEAAARARARAQAGGRGRASAGGRARTMMRAAFDHVGNLCALLRQNLSTEFVKVCMSDESMITPAHAVRYACGCGCAWSFGDGVSG